MKYAASASVITALCYTVGLASATAAGVYIYDGPPHSAERTGRTGSTPLSPVSARLVLAQRAGVEDYHEADVTTDGVVDAINAFGRRTSLFEKDSRRRAFVLVEGVGGLDGVDGVDGVTQYRSFSISPAPAAKANRALWLDLARQAQYSRHRHPSNFTIPYPTYLDMSDDHLSEHLQSKQQWNGLEDFFHLSTSLSDFKDTLAWIHKHDYSLTAYITPPEQSSRTGDDMDQWGSYRMPNTQSPLQKRSAHAQRQQQEKPLEEAVTSSFAAVHSSTVPFSSLVADDHDDDTTPLPAILPQCFTSQTACERQTRNCTGHGKCYLKYTDQTAATGSPAAHCYTCQCQATKHQTGEGKTKTTYWAGSACHKKDISVEFWIIALFSLAIFFLFAFAIGNLWDMGEQELPSVIGAGVSGPRAKR